MLQCHFYLRLDIISVQRKRHFRNCLGMLHAICTPRMRFALFRGVLLAQSRHHNFAHTTMTGHMVLKSCEHLITNAHGYVEV